jgi:hypothetical protein
MSASSLGQRAMSGQLAPFLPDNFYYVVDKTSRSPDRLVLVGEQHFHTGPLGLTDTP